MASKVEGIRDAGARGDRPRDRHGHLGASGPAALGPLPRARHRGPGHHLGAGRARGHPRRLPGGRPAPAADVLLRVRRRAGRLLLPRGRRDRCHRLRLAHGPDRPQKAVLHHAGPLPRRHGGHRPVLEHLELLLLPIPHGGRDRRRVHGDQLDHPGACPGPGPRLDQPRHQRLVLDRRGAGLVHVDRAPQARGDRPGLGLARRLLHRRRHRPRDPAPAHLDPREPPLARDPRLRGGSRPGGHRHREALHRRGRDPAAGGRKQAHEGPHPRPHPFRRCSRLCS